MNGQELGAIKELFETHIGYLQIAIEDSGERLKKIEGALVDPEGQVVKSCVRSKRNAWHISALWKVLSVVGGVALLVLGAFIRSWIA